MTGSGGHPVIDFHAHVLDEEVFAGAADHSVASGFGARPSRPPPGSRLALVIEKMFRPELHVEDMDELGIDIQVLSSSTVVQGSSWADAATDLAPGRRANDTIAD